MNTSTTERILVVGATGFLGSEICRQLIEAKKDVTGLVRKSTGEEKVKVLKQMGVRLVEGDLKDAASIKSALKGITTIISTASSTFSRQDGDSIQTVDNEGQATLVDEAVAAGIPRFVFISFSFMPNDFPLQSAKKRAEKKLAASNMNYTIIKPSFFMEAWLSPAVGFDFPNAKATIYGEGKNKISWISIGDVAAFAAEAAVNPVSSNRVIEIGGPQSLSPLEVVDLFEKSSGKKFELQHVPVEALKGQESAAQDDLSKSFVNLMLMYAAGHEVSMVEPLKLFNHKLRSVHEYASLVTTVH